ncbi:MAG TPA: hypothetical protein VJN18_32990, partial [Polyangiaceae bacterium]|nr:hypothetical protein [Polyangiaceae bacterium]
GAGGMVSVAPEGGSGGAVEAAAGAGGACTEHCTMKNAGQFCGQNQVTWVCNVGFDYELFNQECQDAGTSAIRYCCPPEFAGECP